MKIIYNIITPEVDKNFREHYKELLRKGPFTVTITEYKTQRSLEQNAFYHVLVANMAIEAGYTPAQMKENLKIFNPTENYTVKGKTKTRVKGTSECTVKEMTEVLEKTIALAEGHYNMKIKLPSKYGYEWEIKGIRS